MWVLSGFADEIDDDFERQCILLNELGVTNMELRSAWGVNVLDLSADQVSEAKSILRRRRIDVSSIGSPIAKISITDDFERIYDVTTGRWPLPTSLTRPTCDFSPSSSLPVTILTGIAMRCSDG